MSELVRWTPHTIRVTLQPARTCDADDCERPSLAHVVWLELPAEMLHLQEICGWHLFRLRDKCLVFPLDRCPPLEVIANAYRQEMMRRRPPVQFVQYGFATGTGTGGWGNMGGWNVSFG